MTSGSLQTSESVFVDANYAKPSKPAEPTEPAEVTKSTKPSKPAKPAEPVEPAEPTEPAKFAKPAVLFPSAFREQFSFLLGGRRNLRGL
jgi:uncharacterized membrane protein